MLTIAIAIHKGGTSKTTTAFNLAYELAEAGLRVLLIDLDYQASLTGFAGISDGAGSNITQVMLGERNISDVIRTLRPGLSIIPSDIELSSAEMVLSNKIGRENILKRALAKSKDYDVVLLDCPPSLNVMTVNALSAANGVVVTLTPTATDLRALEIFLTTLNEIKEVINPVLELIGVVLTFYDARYGLHGDVDKNLKDAELPVIARIGRSVRIAESTGAGIPLREYDTGNPQIQNYQMLSKAVITWLNDHR